MLKPVPMSKVAVVGPKTELPATVDALHGLNLLHIQDYTPGESGFELGSPLPGGSQSSERLLRLRGLLKAAQLTPPAATTRLDESQIQRAQKDLESVEAELARLVEQRAKVVDEEARLAEEEAALTRIRNFPLPLQLLSGYRTVSLLVGFLPKGTDPVELRKADPNVEWRTSEEAEGLFIAAAVRKENERALQENLNRLGFVAFELPPGSGRPSDRLSHVSNERARLRTEREGLDTRIQEIGSRHALAFYALDEALSIAADKAASPVRFRTTKNSFVIEGWVPTEDVSKLQTAVEKASHGRAFATTLETGHAGGHGHHGEHDEHAGEAHAEKEEPPTKIYNPGMAAPYELLTDTYSRPKMHEVDPTLFFTLGFPFFYAFMLGDVGYGALLVLLVAMGVFTKLFKTLGFQSTWHLNRILLHAGLLSIVFGLLYGEFFGIEFIGPKCRAVHEVIAATATCPASTLPTGAWIHWETHVAGLEVPISRLHNVPQLLLISLAIAGIHLVIGLLLGIRNGAAAHGFGAAFKHRGGWLLVSLSALLALVYMPAVIGIEAWTVSPPSIYGWLVTGLLVAGITVVLIGEGGMGLFEIPTVMSNFLSYTRLVAIGLSGVGIALAGNFVAKMVMASGGIVGIIGGVIILTLFHGLNLGLGVLGPALHSLRLHYVEFFTKFYEGGGATYSPFGAKRQYTVKEVKQA